ncbi:MAG: T9SS type A sorting domain-containing protein, partial [Hymenobacter sp.]|nr:T9SS type A sorting domain-containing protein [Hymenobacter sp.]
AGGTLGICDLQGIAQTGSIGAVRVTGPRSFSTDGRYVYNNTSSFTQATGQGLPGRVRELVVDHAAGVLLNNNFNGNPGLEVAQVLRLTSGNLVLNTQTLRLLSGPAGTALVDNTGGTVDGTAQVQRYVSGALNAGLGYRHFSAPVVGAPVSQLATGGSPVVVNAAFNAASALVRPTIVPFPTAFTYDQTQVPATGALAAFDQGWTSPTATGSLMSTAQGLTKQAGGAETVTFQGPLNSGPVLVPNLGYGTNAAQAGWHLLGNPYPSPLDWSTLTVGTGGADNLQNLNGAVYVFQSSGQYAGTYRSYVGGIGDPFIASGQGFFVRTAGTGQSGTLRLSNANRVTTWSATNSTLNRNTTDPRPQVHLRVSGGAAGTIADQTTVYFEAEATAAPDARFDAYKLRNPGGAISLFSLVGSDELSINGLPELDSQPRTVPLGLSVSQAGPYTFVANQLHFGPVALYLRDALTGALVNLSQQPRYTFQVVAGDLATTTRFVLEFRPGNALATRAGLDASQVSLFPNPAEREFTLILPGLPTAKTVTAQLVNTLGQTVLTRTLPLPRTGLTARFDVRDLATGVYSLRLSTGGTEVPLTKRLVIE